MADFAEILSWVLVHEGGYVNHPADPGGATNRGVTQRVYDGYRAKNGLPKRGVKAISDDEVEAIYRRQYWDAVRGDDLPDGLNYAVFDFGVNSGPSRAIKFLQSILGVNSDGVIGNVTLGALQKRSDKEAIIVALCENRLSWVKTLKTWKHFGRGWARRIMGEEDGVQLSDTGVIDRAVKLYRGHEVAPPKRVEQGEGKAEQKDEALTRSIIEMAGSKEGVAAAGAVTGIFGTLAKLPEPIQWALAGGIVMTVGGLVAAYVMERRKAA